MSSFFLFSVPLATALEANAEDPPYCLRAAADCLTNALCLPTSISAKKRNRCQRKEKGRRFRVDNEFKTYVDGRRHEVVEILA